MTPAAREPLPDEARGELLDVGRAFGLAGELVSAERIESGHINPTFLSAWRTPHGTRRYVHQAINTFVFRDPRALMSNFVRVCSHVERAVRRAGLSEPERRHLTVVRTRSGDPFWFDPGGRPWRTVLYLEDTHTLEVVGGPDQARAAARAFGAFVDMLSDLSPHALRPTIPDFHDLARRTRRLHEVAAEDARGRAGSVGADLEATQACLAQLRSSAEWPVAQRLPRRVVHNDCKLNNLLLDDRTGAGLCVIDLDTVMQGSVACDFGGLVRTASCRAPEDETRLERVRMDPGLFAALAEGYVEGARFLTPDERACLALAGPWMALEDAVRFLTDHLEGDVYYRIHRDGHNLDRHRAQRTLAERMLEGLDEARRVVASAGSGSTIS